MLALCALGFFISLIALATLSPTSSSYGAGLMSRTTLLIGTGLGAITSGIGWAVVILIERLTGRI